VSRGTDKRRKQLEYKLRNTGKHGSAALKPEQFHLNDWPGQYVSDNTIHIRPDWRWDIGYNGYYDI
jgi:hypothetical protein